MSHKELKFDIEEINSMKSSLIDSANDLETYKEKVLLSLENLKNDWNTSAGINFMSNVDTDWTDEVDKYIKIIGAVKDLLEEAAKEYAKVEEEIIQIKFT